MAWLHPDPKRRTRTFIPRPPWLDRFERTLGKAVPVHPHVVSGLKLAVVAPLLIAAWPRDGELGVNPIATLSMLLLFAAFDYLDGVVARARDLESRVGRVLDRVTDYPLLIGLSWFSADVVPLILVATKLVLDGTLLVLFLLGRGSTQNRLRTLLSTAAVFSLLFLGQGWAQSWVRPWLVNGILGANITLSAAVMAFNLDWLPRPACLSTQAPPPGLH